MKFCTKCGKQHKDSDMFCTGCGNPFAAPAPEQPQQVPAPVYQPYPPEHAQTQPPQQYPPSAPKKKKTGLIIGLSAAAVAGLAVIIGLIIFISGRTVENEIGTSPMPIPTPVTNSVSQDPTPTPTPDPAATPDPLGRISRTFMIYMVGSDLETNIGAATMDIIQILEAETDLEWNNILIMTGGAQEWLNDTISADKTEIYEITEDDIIRVWDSPALNMAAPGTLTAFLDFCTQNYESDAYSLIMWNHGAGPNFGFGYDEISGEILSIPSLVSSLENSSFGADNKLEIIGFDACLMGSVEIAYALSDFASYLISSQDVIPAWGWDYGFFGEIEPDMTAEEIAILIIDMYFDFCEDIYTLRPDFTIDTTLSCLNLENVGELELELNNLYAKAGGMLDASSFPTASNVRNNVKEFGYVNPAFSYDLVDIRHLGQLMKNDYPDEAERLLTALDNLITHNKANIPNANGVSLYFPFNNKELLNELAEFYTGFNFADDYAGFMQKFVALLQDDTEVEWNLSKVPVERGEDATTYSIQLTPEQVETYASAAYYIVQYYNDTEHGTMDGYYFVFNCSDVTLEDDGRLTAHYEGKTQMLYDPEDDSTFGITMLQMEKTDTYVRYAVPTTLLYLNSNDIGDWEIRGAWLYIQTDIDGSNGKVLSVLPDLVDDDTPYIANREVIDIYEYTHMQFYGFGREVSYNDDGSLKPFAEWESTGKYVGWEVELDPVAKNNLTLVQQEHDDEHDYYMLINIKDVYGNVVSSDMIPIN